MASFCMVRQKDTAPCKRQRQEGNAQSEKKAMLGSRSSSSSSSTTTTTMKGSPWKEAYLKTGESQDHRRAPVTAVVPSVSAEVVAAPVLPQLNGVHERAARCSRTASDGRDLQGSCLRCEPSETGHNLLMERQRRVGRARAVHWTHLAVDECEVGGRQRGGQVSWNELLCSANGHTCMT